MSYTSEFPPFYVTVDMVVLADRDGQSNVLLVRRGAGPYAGRLALPGGFVDRDESLDAAARRELREETGVAVAEGQIAQIGAYGEPDRDPRGRIVSVAYLTRLRDVAHTQPGSDASESAWHLVDGLDPATLAFDHARILADALARTA